MQALRNASFMNEPTLTGIKTLLIIGMNLSKTGRIQDAWALFGTTVRLAYSIELHRDPDTLSPPPLQNEKAARQRVWWLMLYSDQCLSSMLCKPLGISSIGNCPRPILFTSNSLELRAASTVHEFTLVAREILGYGGAITSREISVFTKKLEALWNAMPEALHFNVSWLQTEKSRPESPLDVMSASMGGLQHPVSKFDTNRLQEFMQIYNSSSSFSTAASLPFLHVLRSHHLCPGTRKSPDTPLESRLRFSLVWSAALPPRSTGAFTSYGPCSFFGVTGPFCSLATRLSRKP